MGTVLRQSWYQSGHRDAQGCTGYSTKRMRDRGCFALAGQWFDQRCRKIVAKAIAEHKWYDASTLKEPYRIEGKKTMGLEIAEQFGWKMPDVLLYPAGGGVGLIGIYKAFNELKELGWISGDLPRMVAVQAAGCAPIVRAWEAGAKESEFWHNAHTCAFGITVPKAIGDFLVLEAVYSTNGCAVAVPDEATLQAEAMMASIEGAFVCPEGAACMPQRNDCWMRDGLSLKSESCCSIPDAVSSIRRLPRAIHLCYSQATRWSLSKHSTFQEFFWFLDVAWVEPNITSKKLRGNLGGAVLRSMQV